MEKKSSKLSPKSILKSKKILVIVGVVVLLYAMFHLTGQKNKIPQAAEKEKPLNLGAGLMEDDLYNKFEKFIEQEEEAKKTLSDDIQQQRLTQEELEKRLAAQIEELKQLNATEQTNTQSPATRINESVGQYPEPPAHTNRPPAQQTGVSSYQPEATIQTKTWIGGIASKTFKPVEDKKKLTTKPLKFYQPPSFFDAKLLTGIDALTSKSAKSDPEQVFLMITAPAVLPNHIKANLKGCFVVANASGNLAKERVQLQVVNLSCVSADGKAVIDQEVLGFVSDKDGKRDLAGNVVSKSATSMAWLMAASALEAVGESVSFSSVNQSNSALGSVSTINTDRMGERIGGNMVKQASQDYKDIIIEYIKQAAPVVEVGAMKDATVFLQKGVWLEIMNRFDEGVN